MTHNRPVRQGTCSAKEVAVEIVTSGGILCSVIAIAQAWSDLPDIIPIHFSVSGKANLCSSKESLIVLTVINFVISISITLSSRYPQLLRYPWRITEQNAMTQYQNARSLLLWMKIEIAWLIAFVVWQIIRVALGETETLNLTLLLAIVLIVLFTVAIHIYQAYRDR